MLKISEDLHSIELVLISHNLNNSNELFVLVNVQTPDGWFQELPSLIEWEI